MPNTLPPRGPVTDAFIDHLETHEAITEKEILIGDAVVPPAAGWVGNQPGQGLFRASVVVSTGVARPAPAQPETLRSRHSAWAMGYTLRTTGATRQHADRVADRVRRAAVALPRALLELGVDWQIQDVVFESLAPIVVQNPTDAPTFQLDDTCVIWIARTRGSA